MWLKNLNTVSVLNSLRHQNTNIGKPSSKFVAGPHFSLPWKKVNEAIRTFYVPQHCSALVLQYMSIKPYGIPVKLKAILILDLKVLTMLSTLRKRRPCPIPFNKTKQTKLIPEETRLTAF